jgi:inner membrane protein
LLAAFVIGIGFIAMQGYSTMQARSLVAETLRQRTPANRFLDAAMTSFPTNPLCWTFVSVESNEQAGTYTLRRGLLSLAPQILPVHECPSGFFGSLAKSGATGSAISFLSEERTSLDTLRILKAGNCHFEAWLRFARMPSLSKTDAVDIRYGLDREGNFTTFRFADFLHRECPRYVPRWEFPRSDLLQQGEATAAQ